MQVPEEFVAPWREKFPEFENTIGRYSFNTEVRNPVAAFPGMLNRLDLTVKRLLDLLKELDLDENTIIMFSSDNGAHNEGGHRSDLFKSSGPLRGIKRDLYEGGIRVPMLVRWKGTIKPGLVSGHAGAFWDVLPTVAELANVAPTEYPANIDGMSFLPTLRGNEQPSHPYLYWEFYEQGGKIAALWGQWKGIQLNVNQTFGKPNTPIEIYNLDADLGEKKNVATEHPEIVKKFREIFKEAHVASPIFNFPLE
jgi:arylsulfatase A-like enzyme